jgi:glycosyltransferase involved in cell wall biosynthesis
MMISILIANYNSEKFIYNSILSALNQDFDLLEIEIVICDDGSTDNSFEIISGFSNKNIKIISNKINYGIGYTRNRLIDNSKGDWFLFLDSDDLLKSNCVKLFFDEIRDLNKEDYSMFYGNSDYLDLDGKIKKWERSKYFDGTLLSNKFSFPIFHPIFYNRKFYNLTQGIDVNLKCGEDFDLWYKMEEVGKIKFFPISMYIYRINVNGLSQVGKINLKWFEIMLEHAIISVAAAKRRNLDQKQELNEFAELFYNKLLKQKKTGLLRKFMIRLKYII